MKILLTALALALPMSSSGAAAHPAPPPVDHYTALTVTVQQPPEPVVGGDGRKHLAYELLMLNWQQFPATVERIEVLSGDRVIADFRGASLDAVTSSILKVPGRVVAPGTMHKAVLDVTLPRDARPPRTLEHRLTVTTDPELALFASPFRAARTAVSQREPAVLVPPVQGPRWIHLTGCCTPDQHRTVLQGINGKLSLGQRFAYDISRLQPDGRYIDGPADDVHSFAAYGEPLHAAADGTVVSAIDGMPNQVPFQATEPGEPATVLGNSVIIDIGAGRFAAYAHMAPGSVRVASGQRVRAGQVIGQIGNSGFTDAPHVHFQLMDGPSPLGSEGLPFVFRSFDSPGSVPPPDQIDPNQPVQIDPRNAGRHRMALPMILQVVNYPVA
jgi:murein DD-endopeptidase MepM/ murein hydrolase activator NlpD